MGCRCARRFALAVYFTSCSSIQASTTARSRPRARPISPERSFRAFTQSAFSLSESFEVVPLAVSVRSRRAAVTHDLCKLQRIAAPQLRLHLLQTLQPDVPAERAILAQRLLNPAQARLADQRPQQLTRQLHRQRYREAVCELEHDDLLLGTEDQPLLPRRDTARPVRGIHDHVPDCQLHSLSVAAAANRTPCREWLLQDSTIEQRDAARRAPRHGSCR